MNNPVEPSYREKVYNALKSELGDSFNKSKDEFNSLLDTDNSYSQKVYSALKGELGDSFDKSQEEFTSLIQKKKDESQSTGTNTELDSGTQNGSLDSSETPSNNFIEDVNSGKLDDRLTDLQAENDAIEEKTKAEIDDLLLGHQQARELDEIELADIDNTIEEEKSGDFGFWGNIYNKVVTTPNIGNFSNPLFNPEKLGNAEGINDTIKQIADQRNLPEDQVDINEATDIFYNKRKAELIQSKSDAKVEEYIENLDDEQQTKLNNHFNIKAGKLSAQSYNLLIENDKLTNEFKEVRDQLQQRKSTHDNSIKYSPEYYQENQQLSQRYIELQSLLSDNEDKFVNNESDLLDTNNEIDLYKRSYGTGENFLFKASTQLSDLGLNIVDVLAESEHALRELDAEVFGDSEEWKKLRESELQGIKDSTDETRKENNKIREGLRRPKRLEDIEGIESFSEWALDLTAEQVPNILVLGATGGTSGLATLGVSAAGGKLNELEDEEENSNGLINYTRKEKLVASALSGVFEAASEKITFGQLSKMKRVFKSADDFALKKGVTNYLKNTWKPYLVDVAEESSSEGLAQLGNNITDKYFLGKDVSLLDGVSESMISGAFMSGVIFKSPGLVPALKNAFTPKDTNQKLGENVDQILQFSQQLKNPELNEITEKQIRAKKKSLQQQNIKLLNKIAKNVDALDSNQKQGLLEIENERYQLRKEYDAIKNDASISEDIKTNLIADINKKVNEISDRKTKLLTPKNALNVLPEKDQLKLKERAAKELQEEYENDGVQEYEINDEQITERAIQIQKTENATKAKQVIGELFETAKTIKNKVVNKVIRKVDQKEIKVIKEKTGINVTPDFKHTISNEAINHTLKKHGINAEVQDNQLPVQKDDFKLIVDIIDNYDSIEKGTTENDLEAIKYKKTFDDGTTYVVEEVRTGKKELSFKTMYKKKNKVDNSPPSSTSETSLGGSSPSGSMLTNTDQNSLGKTPNELAPSSTKIQKNTENEGTPTNDTGINGKIELGTTDSSQQKESNTVQPTTDTSTSESTPKINKPKVFKTSENKGAKEYTANLVDGKLEFKDSEGNKPSAPTFRKLRNKYAETVKFTDGKRSIDANEAPNFSPDDIISINQFIAENSQNPSEIAEAISTSGNYNTLIENVDYKTRSIAESIGKVSRDSFINFSDKNLINRSIGLQYLSKSEGVPIDLLAQEISENYNIKVSPQDIVDFILDNPKGPDSIYRNVEKKAIDPLKQKFELLTGLPATTSFIEKAVLEMNKLYENPDVYDHYTDAEILSLYREIEQSNYEERANTPDTIREDSNREQTIETNESRPSIQGKSTGNGSKKKERKSILNRAATGGANPKTVKVLEDLGLDYEIQSQQETKAKAKQFVDKVGLNEAINFLKSGVIKSGAELAFIFSEVIEQNEARIDQLSDQKRTKELEKKEQEYLSIQEEIFDSFDKTAREFGRFISALNNVYNSSNYKYNIANQISNYKARNPDKLDYKGDIPADVLKTFQARDAILKEFEAKIQELEEKLKQAEAKQSISNIEESIRRSKRKKPSKSSLKKASKILRKAKFTKSASDMAKLQSNPVGAVTAVWDGAIETVATILDAGGTIEQALKEGIITIKESDWYKSLNKNNQKVVESRFEDDVYDIINEDETELEIAIDEDGKITIPANVIRHYVANGVTDINKLSQIILDEFIKSEYPDITVRQVRDAITGYGKTINPTQDELAEQISKMKNLGKIISGMEDVAKGQRPKRSGYQRRKKTDEERRKERILKDAMKDLKVDEADIKKQWKNRLDTVKSRLKNQISDLEEQIENKEKLKPERTPIEYDQEALDLKNRRDELRDILQSIVGKKELTEEEKILRVENGLQNSIDRLEKDIELNNIGFKPKKAKLNSPRIEQLRARQQELKDVLNKMREESGLLRQRQLKNRKKAIQDKLEKLQEKRRNKDYAKKKRKESTEFEELATLKREYNREKEKYDQEAYEDELRNKPTYYKLGRYITSLVGLQRVLLATGEFSFIFLQNAAPTVNLLTTKPRKLINILGKTIRSYKQSNFDKDYAKLEEHELYDLAVKSKVALTRTNYKLAAKEETFQSDVITSLFKILGESLDKDGSKKHTLLNTVKKQLGFDVSDKEKFTVSEQIRNLNPFAAMERFTTTYSNEIKMHLFEQSVRKLNAENKNPIDHKDDFKRVAKAINTLTGRADLGNFNSISPELNAAFFSVRFATSTFNKLNPYWYANVLRDSEQPFKPSVAQKLALAQVATYIGTTTTFILALQQLGGKDEDEEYNVQIETDATSSDFGKLKIGNIRFDPWGGHLPWITFMARMWTGKMKKSNGKTIQLGEGRNDTRRDKLVDFVAGKLNPTLATINRFANAHEEIDGTKRDKYGNVVSVEEELKQIYPIYIQGIQEIVKESPEKAHELTYGLTALGFLGVNNQVYGTTPKARFKSYAKDIKNELSTKKSQYLRPSRTEITSDEDLNQQFENYVLKHEKEHQDLKLRMEKELEVLTPKEWINAIEGSGFKQEELVNIYRSGTTKIGTISEKSLLEKMKNVEANYTSKDKTELNIMLEDMLKKQQHFNKKALEYNFKLQ